jgi:hypothetical protein
MGQREIVFWLIALLCAVLLSSTGCGAAYYSAKTVATYRILPDGTLEASYDSSKEAQGLDLDVENDNGKIKVVKIHVDKAGTNESAIAAALAANLKLIDLVNALTAAAANKGAVP